MLSFGRSLVKYILLNSEPCLAKGTIIGLNPTELRFYPFMVSLDRCSGSCNIFDDLFDRPYIPNKLKDVNVIE